MIKLDQIKHANRLPVQQVDGHTITGNGHVHSDRCGNIASVYHKFRHTVKEKSHWRVLTYYCHTQDCPECNEVWSTRAAKEAAINLYMKATMLRTVLHHDIISWSIEHYENAKASSESYNDEHKKDDDYRPTDVWDYLEKRMHKLLHYLHVGSHPLGYSYVHHPYSLACLKCGNRLDKENNDKVPLVCPSCHSELSYGWRFHPHTHIISNSFTRIKTVTAQEALDGDVYKNIRRVTAKNEIGTPKEKRAAAVTKLFKLIRYELTHALQRNGRHAINHCGAFANVHWNTGKMTVQSEYDDGDGIPFVKTMIKRVDGDDKTKKVLMKQLRPVYALHDGNLVPLKTTITYLSISPKKVITRRVIPARTVHYTNPNTGLREFVVHHPEHFKDVFNPLKDFKRLNGNLTGQMQLDAFLKVLPKRYYFVKGVPIELTRTGRLKSTKPSKQKETQFSVPLALS